jgi:hypothetical protein
MVLAKDRLVTVGMPGALTPQDPFAPYESRGKALLEIYSTSDGEQNASIEMAAGPSFDGMSAARGKLFVVTVDGRLECYGGR